MKLQQKDAFRKAAKAFWQIVKQGGSDARRARTDAPETLHHVVIRGIERGNIVGDDREESHLRSCQPTAFCLSNP